MAQTTDDLRHALSLMQTALDVLDRTGAAHEVGAHLDLAICRLSDLIADNEIRAELAVRNEQTH